MNFNAGPSALPVEALETAGRELLDFSGTGMSVMEQSHRGKDYEAVHDEAIALLRELLSVPSGYEVLFLQGGASMQFAQVPMSFLERGASADYVVNGAWGEKAFSEGKLAAAMNEASVRIAANTAREGKSPKYVRVPSSSEIKLEPKAAYVHITSNETIDGIEVAPGSGEAWPELGSAPIVCDMSSDIMGRSVDVSRYAFIYAGAQKNLGPSGVTIVIARKEQLEKGRKNLPKILQYRVHAENKSLLNTPPTFGIYLMCQVLRWSKSIGGLPAIEKRNREKARYVYEAIDQSGGLYTCPVDPANRSIMNVVFRCKDEATESAFLAEAKKHKMAGLKGHRSVGGIRASLYNAVPVEHAAALGSFMREFVRSRG
jgi:phosphoserine aminotransferase